MSSGPRDAVGAAASSIPMTSARGQEGNGGGARRRMRIKYSRDFLLAVGGSEACRRGKPLPADMRTSVLIMVIMQLWSMDPTTTDQLQGETTTEAGDETAGGGDGTAAGNSVGAREPDALQIGIRRKSKPCTEFFSSAGCRFGENCLFIHNFPVGYHTVADARVLGSPAAPAHPPGSIPTGPPVPDGPPTPTVKARPRNSAHNEKELDKPRSMDNFTPPLMDEKPTSHSAPQPMRNPGMATPAGFGASATAKISVDATLTDAIIGSGRDNVKLISLGRGSESFQTGVGSKSKPCIKFFSTIGCPFGEGCHFLHHFPGGHQAIVKMSNLGGPTFAHPPGIMPMRPAVPNGPSTSTVKTRLCRNYNTAEGCRWGHKCHFAHGEREPSKSMSISMASSIPPHMGPRPTSHFAPSAMPNPGMATPASFGASATAKISVDASLASAIIGRGGMNTKLISQITGAKLAIQDHESDASVKNIELEGTFDQINNAGTMVRELIVSFGVNKASPQGSKPAAGCHPGGAPRRSFKTKLCENFAKGLCTYGDKCRFAHGENELRKSTSA